MGDMLFSLVCVSLVLATPFARATPVEKQQEQWTRLLVATGETTELDMELVDLVDPSYTCDMPNVYSLLTREAVGAVVEGQVRICGGAYSCTDFDYCYVYEKSTDTWDETDHLANWRRSSAGVLLDDGRWWISGGSGLATSEIYETGVGFSFFLDLPRPSEGHCLIKVDSTRYFFVGGYPFDKKTYMLDMSTQVWTEMPPLVQERYNFACGLVTRNDGSQEIVISGGKDESTTLYSSTEIFSLTDMTWRAGTTDFPLAFESASSVQFGDSFVVVGGSNVNEEYLDTIYQYEPNSESWILMEQKLSKARNNMVALLVSDDQFAQC